MSDKNNNNSRNSINISVYIVCPYSEEAGYLIVLLRSQAYSTLGKCHHLFPVQTEGVCDVLLSAMDEDNVGSEGIE